jgi:hypothetical protein
MLKGKETKQSFYEHNNIEENIMSFTDWLTFGMKKNKDVNVEKIKAESVDMGSMAAGSPSEAAGSLARMMDQKNAPTKVLMVQDGEYMPQVTDYALKMAQRLDCEIIALDVTDAPLQFSGDRKQRETDRFMEMAKQNGEKFLAQATARGIKVDHVMEVGNPDEVVARLSADDAGIRYVLSKPEADGTRVDQKRAHVPVFDLNCSRL